MWQYVDLLSILLWSSQRNKQINMWSNLIVLEVHHNQRNKVSELSHCESGLPGILVIMRRFTSNRSVWQSVLTQKLCFLIPMQRKTSPPRNEPSCRRFFALLSRSKTPRAIKIWYFRWKKSSDGDDRVEILTTAIFPWNVWMKDSSIAKSRLFSYQSLSIWTMVATRHFTQIDALFLLARLDSRSEKIHKDRGSDKSRASMASLTTPLFIHMSSDIDDILKKYSSLSISEHFFVARSSGKTLFPHRHSDLTSTYFLHCRQIWMSW